MRYIIVSVTSILATISAVLLVMLGMDYIDPEIGHGLHPLIAFPAATLLISAAIVLAVLAMTVDRIEIHDELDDLMVKHY